MFEPLPRTSLSDIVDHKTLHQLLACALSQGGDFAEIYVERSHANKIALEEGSIRTATYDITLGVGIRVICGEEVGYAYCDDLSLPALRKTAQVAGSIARSGQKTVIPKSLQKVSGLNRYPVATLPDDSDATNKAALLLRGHAAACAHDARIVQVMGAFVDQTKDILIANSTGHLHTDCQMMCRLHLSTVARHTTGEQRSGFYGGGGRVELNYFDTWSPEAIGREAARMAIAQLGAKAAPAGAQTVVLSPGWSGILLHEAIGHGLEADFIRKGTSLYTGKVGTQVASKLCTVIDNGSIPHQRGSLNIDDEGNIPQETVLIENGILKGYMSDTLSAKLMGSQSTGNGRRESYQHAPMPRMTNTYLAKGPHTHEEIIDSVEKGLYCASLGGGQVDIANGNFVFEVKEAYMIEHGKLTHPVGNATLIGVGPQVLQQISMVGNNPQFDPGLGTCGKDGQSVPVGVGLPTVRIDQITVGGTHA